MLRGRTVFDAWLAIPSRLGPAVWVVRHARIGVSSSPVGLGREAVLALASVEAGGGQMIDGQGPLQGLGVTVGFLDGRAVVGIPGEVDSVTGPDLAAVVDAVLARRHLSVVFALPEVTFMDGRGVRVIDNYVRRLGQIGGSVAIRSPSVVIAWVVDVVGLSGAVRVERSDREPDRLAAEQFAAAPGVPIVVETNPDGGPVRAVTAIPTRTDAALRLVVAVARLPRARGVGVTEPSRPADHGGRDRPDRLGDGPAPVRRRRGSLRRRGASRAVVPCRVPERRSAGQRSSPKPAR